MNIHIPLPVIALLHELENAQEKKESDLLTQTLSYWMYYETVIYTATTLASLNATSIVLIIFQTNYKICKKSIPVL